MELPVFLQLRQAAIALASGLAAALVYDALAVLRSATRLRVLPDLAFCAFLAAMYFYLGLEVGGGRLRLFMLVFIFLGMWGYFGLSRGKMRRLFYKIFTLFVKIVSVIKKLFEKLIEKLKKYGKILKKLFKNLWKRCILYSENGTVDTNGSGAVAVQGITPRFNRHLPKLKDGGQEREA